MHFLLSSSLKFGNPLSEICYSYFEFYHDQSDMFLQFKQNIQNNNVRKR